MFGKKGSVLERLGALPACYSPTEVALALKKPVVRGAIEKLARVEDATADATSTETMLLFEDRKRIRRRILGMFPSVVTVIKH